MFQKVRNIGGRAECQENETEFRIMRKAQFQGWNEEMLASYQRDLIIAERTGHNLLAEKYGYMMKWTHPEEYEQIRDMLPLVSEEKQQLVDEIVSIEIRQTEQFRAMYPNLGRRGRPLRAADDVYGTSVETYARGELMTYSVETLRQYWLHRYKMDRNQTLIPLIVMEATVRASGYRSLDDAEQACG